MHNVKFDFRIAVPFWIVGFIVILVGTIRYYFH